MFFLGITDMFHNNKIAKTDKYVLWRIKNCGQTKFCLTANFNAYHLINIFLPLSVI